MFKDHTLFIRKINKSVSRNKDYHSLNSNIESIFDIPVLNYFYPFAYK